jgi:hypothetical protein
LRRLSLRSSINDVFFEEKGDPMMVETEIATLEQQRRHYVAAYHQAQALADRGDPRAARYAEQVRYQLHTVDADLAKLHQQVADERATYAKRAIHLAKQAQDALQAYEAGAAVAAAVLAEAMERMLNAHAEFAALQHEFLSLLNNAPGGPGVLIGELQRSEVDQMALLTTLPGTGRSPFHTGYTPPHVGVYSDLIYAVVERHLREQIEAQQQHGWNQRFRSTLH